MKFGWIDWNTIYGSPDNPDPYMTRVWIGRLRLHIFHRGDGDPDPHDHPWDFWTFPLTSYVEEVTTCDPQGHHSTVRQVVRGWRLHHRPGTHTHRVLGRLDTRRLPHAGGRQDMDRRLARQDRQEVGLPEVSRRPMVLGPLERIRLRRRQVSSLRVTQTCCHLTGSVLG